MSKFIHIKNWGSRSVHETWVPVDKEGNTIPHIYGYMVSDKDAKLYINVDVKNSDLYELKEIKKSRVGLLGTGITGHPTGQFYKISHNRINAKVESSVYCDQGCDGCGHEYEHFDLVPIVISGCFAVPKGSKISRLVRVEGGGASNFPNKYKLP